MTLEMSEDILDVITGMGGAVLLVSSSKVKARKGTTQPKKQIDK